MYGYISMIFRNSNRKVYISQWLSLTYYFKTDLTEILFFIKTDEQYMEWQRVTKSESKWYNEWQRVTQRVVTSDSK